MGLVRKNFAYSTVATAPSPSTSGTSLVVAAATGARFPTVPFYATVWPASTNALSSNAEVVKVTAISTDTFTIVRAQEGSTARSVLVGDQIAQTVTNQLLTDLSRVVNVRDYGALGDNSTDDIAAITAAIAASNDYDTIVFPNTGTAYRVSTPIDLFERRNYVFGWQGQWIYNYTSPTGSSIKATSGFTGSAIVRIREKTLTGRSNEADGIYVEGLVADAGAASGTVGGVLVEGLCRDLSFYRCATRSSKTTHGWEFKSGTGSGGTSSVPRGVRMNQCVSNASASTGFKFSSTTDCHLRDCLAVSNTDAGFYFTGSAENEIIGCRSVFNGASGFYFDGTGATTSTSLGQTSIVGCGTDRNNLNGFLFENTGVWPIQVVGCRARRDASGLTGSPDLTVLAGFKVNGSTAPIEFVGCQTTPGKSDTDTGNESPYSGMRIVNGTAVTVNGGDIWGVTNSLATQGTNTGSLVTPETHLWTGVRGSKTADTASEASWNTLYLARAAAQPLDATLTALAGVSTAADKVPYFTGTDTVSTATLTSFARTVLDDTDATTMKTTLTVGYATRTYARANWK